MGLYVYGYGDTHGSDRPSLDTPTISPLDYDKLAILDIFVRGTEEETQASTSPVIRDPSSLTLWNIGVTLMIGAAVGVLCFVVFGLSIYSRNPNVAPRCTARPKDVIYKANATENDIQYRGNPFCGWIFWVLSLSYDTMLRGVPGTGTRHGGMEGRMLSVNMDGIVLLRYHHIGYKVALLTTFICMCVILPLNLTAQCYDFNTTAGQAEFNDYCRNPNNSSELLTTYQRTTLANIPSVTNTTEDITFSLEKLRNTPWFGYPYSRTLVRLYIIAICSWIVYVYTCKLLYKEWQEVLALRRVYYLQNEVWLRRRQELMETLEKKDKSLYDSEYDIEFGAQDHHEEELSLIAKPHQVDSSLNLIDSAEEQQIDHDRFYDAKFSLTPACTMGYVDGEFDEESNHKQIDSYNSQVSSSKEAQHQSNGQDNDGHTAKLDSVNSQSPHFVFKNLQLLRQSLFNTNQVKSDNEATTEAEAERGFMSSFMQSGLTERTLKVLKSTTSPFKERYERRELLARRSKRMKDPWIVDPEVRETVPNIELYSVLVGNIPTLPREIVYDDEDEMIEIDPNDVLKWQLDVVSSFFDQCVPNQPGFTSSVAAVTILPEAKDLALAWRKWYCAASALRRLRLIRNLIAQRIAEEDSEFSGDEGGHVDEYDENDNKISTLPHSPKVRWDQGSVDAISKTTPRERIRRLSERQQLMKKQYESFRVSEENRLHGQSAMLIESRQVFGYSDNLQVEETLFEALNYGPEQSAVYSRELAQGAFACCPFGCNEEKLRAERQLTVLFQMELDAVQQVHNAHLDLQNAREKAASGAVNANAKVATSPISSPNRSKKDMQTSAAPSPRFPAYQSNMGDRVDDALNQLEIQGSAKEAELQKKPEHILIEKIKTPKSHGGRKLQQPSDASCFLPDDYQDEGSSKASSISRSTSKLSATIKSLTTSISRYSYGDDSETDIELTKSSVAAPMPFQSKIDTNTRTSRTSDQYHPTTFEISSKDHDEKSIIAPPPPPKLSPGISSYNYENPFSAFDPDARGEPNRLKGDRPHIILSLHGDMGSGPYQRGLTGRSFRRTIHSETISSNELENLQGMMGQTGDGLLTKVLDSEGRFIMKRPQVLRQSSLGSSDKSEHSSLLRSFHSLNVSRHSASRVHPSFGVESQSSNRRLNQEPSDQWQMAADIRRQNNKDFGLLKMIDEDAGVDNEDEGVSEGVWNKEIIQQNILNNAQRAKYCFTHCCGVTKQFFKIWSQGMKEDFTSKASFAVVTFTNRQAAVAARHCLADGRGEHMWEAQQALPLPPLADSVPCDFVTCRGCCKPITISINRNHLAIRRTIATLLLIFVYIFYTFIFSFIASLLTPQSLAAWFPAIEDTNKEFFNAIVEFMGIIPAALQTLSLSVAPFIFKMIANSGSGATSLAGAEGKALEYYWWFILITAFTGSSIATTVINTVQNGQLQDSATKLLIVVGNTIPTQYSFVWINWLIIRFTIIMPNQYLLQLNTFLFQFLGWNCCMRMNSGGMNGPEVPYRIYVDSGTAFLCIVGLSFASPLVAPAALAYYLMAVPLLRRNSIFIYRPRYDGGGFRFPFLFDVFISSMALGQLLLAVMFLLKQAPGPAIMAIFPFAPTLVFRTRCRNRFLAAFQDAGLLQMSLLDEWDNTVPTSIQKRRQYLNFLVDAHKAAYVPVCIAGDTVNVLTSEPAKVEPLDHDQVLPEFF